jgi:membrane-bound lytic murein transglycosylase B
MASDTPAPARTPAARSRARFVAYAAGLLATLALTLTLVPAPAPAQGDALRSWLPLIKRLADDGLDRAQLARLFARPEARYMPEAMGRKMGSLFRRKYEPPEPKADSAQPDRPRVYRSMLEPVNLHAAREYLQRHGPLFQSAHRRFGVPAEVAVAVLSVETKLGRFLGREPAFATLASMALSRNAEHVAPFLEGPELTSKRLGWVAKRTRQKSDWAYDELKALLRYSEANNMDPLALPGSIYGAIGLCQFMPSNALRYGVDGDQDGRVDLFVEADAVHSLSNYLHAHGWKAPDMSEKRQHRVLLHYNRSTIYANTVLALAETLRTTTVQ